MDALCLSAEFVLVADGEEAHRNLSHGGFDRLGKGTNIPLVHSQGYIESVLDEAIEHTSGKYILRIDDDESISNPMFRWVVDREYESADNWTFPRAHLWGDEANYIVNSPLWPDSQTRLSIRAKAGGRLAIHAPSPHGAGEIAPCPILHHKFLVRDYEDRKRILDGYESKQRGAGSGDFLPFSFPTVLPDLKFEPISKAYERAALKQ
jgi:glycosyltransferase involved in cell wall biosynthesis